MLPVRIFLAICIGRALSYEIHQRTSKIRFPTEATPLTQQIYNVGPSQLYEAESQAVPVVIKGINSVPFTVLHQVPITNIPYGELNAKGFNDGLVPYYQPLIRQDSEFHHTVPPPIRIPYPHQKTITISKPKQQVQLLHNVQHKPQRHQERIRVSTPKYTQHYPMKTRPSIPTLQPANSQPQLSKDVKPHLPMIPVYKYPVVMKHIPQNTQYNEYPESDYEEEVYRRPTPSNKFRVNQETKAIPQYSEEYQDFEEKVPQWKLNTGGGFRDTSIESNSHFYKKEKLQRPETEDSKYYDDDTDESSSYEDQQQESLPNFNRYNKSHFPLKTSDEFYRPKNELKKGREPNYENLKQYNYHAKPTSVEFFSSKDITDSFPFVSKTEKYKQPVQYNIQNDQKNQEINSPKLITGSEWIPINAPDGTLPAKSYDIPAPDLSRGHTLWHNSHESLAEQRPDDNINIRENIRNQRPNNVVYGGRKPQGEGVVSASVMVKQ